MTNQKGQVVVVILVLFVVVFIIYANFSPNKSLLKQIFPSSSVKSTPSQGTKASVPSKQEPSLVISPTPVLSDSTSPVRSNIQPKDKSSLPPETRKTTISLETNEKAICKYSDVSGVSYDTMQWAFDQTNALSHSVSITGLSEGGAYKYYIKCADEKGNKNTDDLAISFSVKMPEDKTPPVLRNPSHQGSILPLGTKEQVISISTDEPASCSYSGSASGSFSYYDQTKKFHTKNITGLKDGKAYDFFVRCKDLAGNSNTGDVLINFKVGIPY